MSWWRHQMETFSALLAICAGNSSVTGKIPCTKASDAELWSFLICAWINGWVNNREAGNLRRLHAHYDVIVMFQVKISINTPTKIICMTSPERPWWRRKIFLACFETVTASGSVSGLHNVESPSMVYPQWNIWYWGSKWNLHTVCLDVVGCEWDTASVYFGITYVCFIPCRLPVFAVEPQYLHRDILFLSTVSFEGHIQNLKKIPCWFKIWMGFVGPILIKLGTSSVWGFLYSPVWWPLECYLCKHAGDHSVTTEACSSPHLTSLGLCGMAAWKLNGANYAMLSQTFDR